MQHRSFITIALITFITIAAVWPVASQAQWNDDFESYSLGGIHGQNGWAGWNNDPAFDALISDNNPMSGSQSLAVFESADILQLFNGYTTGIWTVSVSMFIPNDYTGSTNFIVLNTYTHGGVKNWSTDVFFWAPTNEVTDIQTGVTLPMIRGEWVELNLIINLNENQQRFYYGDDMLFEKSWTEGESGGGALNIGAIDLFANNASVVYYDNLSLTEGGVVTTESMSFGSIKCLFR